MFETLSERLTRTFKNITGLGRLTAENIEETRREIQQALLEADVALPVVKQFVAEISERAIGQDVSKSLNPGQTLIKIVHDELIKTMGEATPLNLNTTPPAVFLMAGLQGSGKTTSVAKLARWLKETQKKSVLVASADIYRPAAIAQLETLAKEVDITFFPSSVDQDPVTIAKNAVNAAKTQFKDIVIIDTAGRLHIDAEMMDEIKRLHIAIQPIETLLVVDSMTGQDAAKTVKTFHETLDLTGVILTKTDGDARGGAALSIRSITGKPIKFIGTGEKTGALEAFYPDRWASRILGMGDVLTLIEEVERKVDRKEAEKLAKKIKKGKTFDLEDFRTQLQQMKNMGGMMGLLDKLPGMGNIKQLAQNKLDDKLFIRFEAMINSMTPKERRFPDSINGSRKRRITEGSGTHIQDLNRLLKQFSQMQKMMKKFSGGNMGKMMQRMKHLMPGGMGGSGPGGFGGMFG